MHCHQCCASAPPVESNTAPPLLTTIWAQKTRGTKLTVAEPCLASLSSKTNVTDSAPFLMSSRLESTATRLTACQCWAPVCLLKRFKQLDFALIVPILWYRLRSGPTPDSLVLQQNQFLVSDRFSDSCARPHYPHCPTATTTIIISDAIKADIVWANWGKPRQPRQPRQALHRHIRRLFVYFIQPPIGAIVRWSASESNCLKECQISTSNTSQECQVCQGLSRAALKRALPPLLPQTPVSWRISRPLALRLSRLLCLPLRWSTECVRRSIGAVNWRWKLNKKCLRARVRVKACKTTFPANTKAMISWDVIRTITAIKATAMPVPALPSARGRPSPNKSCLWSATTTSTNCYAFSDRSPTWMYSSTDKPLFTIVSFSVILFHFLFVRFVLRVVGTDSSVWSDLSRLWSDNTQTIHTVILIPPNKQTCARISSATWLTNKLGHLLAKSAMLS